MDKQGASPGEDRADLAAYRRLRLAMLLLNAGTAVWLLLGGLLAQGGLLARLPAALLGLLLLLNAFFFRLDGLRHSQALRLGSGRWSAPARILLALGGPFTVFPAGLLALLLSPFAAPSLVFPQLLGGVLALWPALEMFGLALLFALRRRLC